MDGGISSTVGIVAECISGHEGDDHGVKERILATDGTGCDPVGHGLVCSVKQVRVE